MEEEINLCHGSGSWMILVDKFYCARKAFSTRRCLDVVITIPFLVTVKWNLVL
jgi:hypothetical protein